MHASDSQDPQMTDSQSSHATGILKGGRDVVFTKENSSCLLRAHDGTRRLVRMHRMYDEYRRASRDLPGCGALPWPDHSSSVCWYCRRRFDTVPVKIPMCRNVDGSLTVMGNFCTFACTVSYMWKNRTLTTPEQMAILIQLAEDCGLKDHRLPMAPPLEDLQESGGDMSWEEFDRLCSTTCVRVTTRLPPMVETMIGIEETFEAISAGYSGMDKVLEDIFAITPHSVQKCKAIGDLHEHSVATERVEHMGIDAGTRPKKSIELKDATQNRDGGAMRRRAMAIMNEPATVALDRLKPPTQEEIERRLQSRSNQQHSVQTSLYEEYVKKRQAVDDTQHHEDRDLTQASMPVSNGEPIEAVHNAAGSEDGSGARVTENAVDDHSQAPRNSTPPDPDLMHRRKEPSEPTAPRHTHRRDRDRDSTRKDGARDERKRDRREKERTSPSRPKRYRKNRNSRSRSRSRSADRRRRHRSRSASEKD